MEKEREEQTKDKRKEKKAKKVVQLLARTRPDRLIQPQTLPTYALTLGVAGSPGCMGSVWGPWLGTQIYSLSCPGCVVKDLTIPLGDALILYINHHSIDYK